MQRVRAGADELYDVAAEQGAAAANELQVTQRPPVAAIRSASLQLLLMQGGWAAGQERRREGPQAVHQYQRVQLAAARQQVMDSLIRHCSKGEPDLLQIGARSCQLTQKCIADAGSQSQVQRHERVRAARVAQQKLQGSCA